MMYVYKPVKYRVRKVSESGIRGYVPEMLDPLASPRGFLPKAGDSGTWVCLRPAHLGMHYDEASALATIARHKAEKVYTK